jgi:hypothetical protein
MHRSARAAAGTGYAVSRVVVAVVAFVVCVIFVLPFLLLVVLDELVGERAPMRTLTVVPPAPPQRPAEVPVWSHRAA